MSIHRFDRIDLRVSDFAEARKFYDVYLPALGFPKICVAPTWKQAIAIISTVMGTIKEAARRSGCCMLRLRLSA
jgi:hypothetical protein